MLDYVKVSWKWWNERNMIRNDQTEIFRSLEEANAFIEELKNLPGIIHIHKSTCEYFKLNTVEDALKKNEEALKKIKKSIDKPKGL